MKNNNKSLKECATSTRVFKMLIFLSKHNATIQDIINYFEHNYTNEAILKYINTLKYCGINIEKNRDLYSVKNLPPYFSLNDDEIEGLRIINKMSSPEDLTIEKIQEFTFNLEKHMFKSTKSKLHKKKLVNEKINSNQKYNTILEQIKTCIEKNILIKIILKNKSCFTGIPKDIYYDNNKMYCSLCLENNSTKYDIDITKITEINQFSKYNNTDSSNKKIPFQSNITFKLKDRLAKSYKLKEGESVIKTNEDGSKIIVNKMESENKLLHRLLRYDTLCEVISPKTVRIKMEQLIDGILNLYQ